MKAQHMSFREEDLPTTHFYSVLNWRGRESGSEKGMLVFGISTSGKNIVVSVIDEQLIKD
jgi:hypothetical protein